MTIQFAPLWNNSTLPFTCIKGSVTDTGSDATSTLIDILVNGTSKFKVDKNGIPTFGGAYSFPSSDGAANSVLSTNGSGVLSFQDVNSTSFLTNFVPYTGASGAVDLGSNALTTGAITTSGQFINNQGTLTSSSPLTLTQTWNSGATVFTGLYVNITDTSSSSSSLFADFQVGGTSKLKIGKDGTLTFNTYSYLTPGIIQGAWGVSVGGNNFGCGGIIESYNTVVKDYGAIKFGSTASGPWFYQTYGTHILNQRNGTNAQTFRIANTFTSDTNFEFGQLGWNTNEFRIGTTVGSAGGTQRALVFGQTNAAGTFTHQMSIAPTQNCVQIGVQNTSYYPTRLMVSTDNTSTTIGGASVSDQGIYVTNSTNTINRPVGLQIGGYGGWAHCGIFGVMTNTGGNTGGDILLAMRLNAYSAGSLSSVARWYGPTGKVVFSGAANGTGGGNTTDTQFTVTVPDHNNQITTVESPDVLFTLGSKTWAAGNITTQRFFRITAPTANFASASTITTASTLSIGGAPVAGTNATITTAYALNVESGNSNFGGGIRFGTTDGTNAGYLNFVDRCSILASGYNCLAFSFGSMLGWNAVWGSSGLQLNSRTQGFGWGTTYANQISFDAALYSPAVNVIEQRLGTNAQTFRVYNTYTSSTNAEWFQQSWVSNEIRLGTAVGSAGGTQRGLSLGTWNAAGTFTNLLYLSPTTGGVSIYNGSASGTGSFCGAVHSGTANVSGQYAVAFGSSYFTVSGTRSFLIAGDFTTVSGTACFAHGYLPGFGGPTVAGTGNFCTAGGASASTANWGFAHGQSAETRLPGQLVYAAGRFSALADAQATKFILRIKTTDATATTMMLDGSTTRLTIPSGKMMFADIWISGIKSDGSAAATYRRKVAIKNVGGTTSLIGSVETIGTDYEDNVLTDVAITADDTNDALQINVTGIAAETWRWVAVVEGLEIAYGV